MAENKKVSVKIGRQFDHRGVAYGTGTYQVDPQLAKELQAKGAELSSAAYIGTEKKKAAADAEPDLSAAEALAADRSKQERRNPIETGEADQSRLQAGTVGDAEVSQLQGPLPEDFPAKAELESAGITGLDQLVGKTADDLKAIQGIGEKKVEAIGLRLYQLAEAQSAAQQ